MSWLGGKLDQIQGKPQNAGLRQCVDPRDIRTPAVDILQHLHQFVVIVVFELELQCPREEQGHDQQCCEHHNSSSCCEWSSTSVEMKKRHYAGA
ncbi:hypothetical protein TcasGA2_TC005117 [Tribolium castaneum]|uniref:Uncharacterized protein n=1 Tax=Tribolium castaneum TaxID=7070 RepID=D7EIQ1_TRICA|nr:hypothetical protein TcasGA2_TC005117 [Tribolium castaneum]